MVFREAFKCSTTIQQIGRCGMKDKLLRFMEVPAAFAFFSMIFVWGSTSLLSTIMVSPRLVEEQVLPDGVVLSSIICLVLFVLNTVICCFGFRPMSLWFVSDFCKWFWSSSSRDTALCVFLWELVDFLISRYDAWGSHGEHYWENYREY